MDTLRKAIQDNRGMFVTMRNRFIEEMSKMHNSVVEDLESLSKEITFTQEKVEEVDVRRTKDAEEVSKGFMEMEAFINTLIFNEKAARIAMTTQLSEDVDRVTRDYTKKIDDVATYCGDINAALESATNDLGNLDTEHTNFYYEFQNYKDSNENAIRDIVIRMTMEKMMNMLETYDVNVKTIANRDKTLVGKIALQERAAPRRGATAGSSKKPKPDDDINEVIDRKLDKVYERVRNDNWVIWKESIRLAEKEFNESGIKKTMDFLPKVTYDRNDLKRTINSLMHDDAEQLPRPIVKTSNINKKSPPSKKPDTRQSDKSRTPPKSPPKSPPKDKSRDGRDSRGSKPSRQDKRRDDSEESKR